MRRGGGENTRRSGGAPPTVMAAGFDDVRNSDDYEKIEKLGEGTYGVVYKARVKATGELVAMKKVRMDAWDDGVPATALREIAVLKKLRHPNVVSLTDVFISHSGNLYMVFELLERDLKERLDQVRHVGGLGVSEAKALLVQLLRGTHSCHVRSVLHRDLKPQNILLGPSRRLKIADFGLARCFAVPPRRYTHEVVTLWYRAPEILLGEPVYNTPVDVWSIGCIFAEMVNGRPLFSGDSEVGQLMHIFRVLGTPSEATWPGVSELRDYNESFPVWPKKPLERVCPKLDAAGVDLVARMLTYDPRKRITVRQALQHPFLADVVLDSPPPPAPCLTPPELSTPTTTTTTTSTSTSVPPSTTTPTSTIPTSTPATSITTTTSSSSTSSSTTSTHPRVGTRRVRSELEHTEEEEEGGEGPPPPRRRNLGPSDEAVARRGHALGRAPSAPMEKAEEEEEEEGEEVGGGVVGRARGGGKVTREEHGVQQEAAVASRTRAARRKGNK